jgi:cell wall-associated NlpC family hydrolase
VKSGAVIGVLVTSAALAPSALAPTAALGAGGGHHHAPNAAQLAQSRREVAARQHQVQRVASRIGTARGALQRLNVTAEVAAEKYDAAQVKLTTTQNAAHTAQVVLGAANRQVDKGTRKTTQFVQAAYEGGGLTPITAYLEPGGPSQLARRLGAIQAINQSEHTVLEQLQAAQIYRGVVSDRAQAVEAKATRAATVAARARQTAANAVAQQQAALAALQHQQAHLQSLLSSAKSTASRLAREHLAALARARRRAAQRAAAPPPSGPTHSPFSGSSGSTSGTVSATTAAGALSQAESQIGKPYQWGAAGPNTYDCSGLVLWAYAQEGVHLDHWTGDQWNEGAHVSRTELRPGDLVFFAYNVADPSTIHHVGMYVGNGQMVDAPYTGVDVRYDSAFRSDYIGAVRPYQR